MVKTQKKTIDASSSHRVDADAFVADAFAAVGAAANAGPSAAGKSKPDPFAGWRPEAAAEAKAEAAAAEASSRWTWAPHDARVLRELRA